MTNAGIRPRVHLVNMSMAPPDRFGCLVADPRPVVRQGLRRILEQDGLIPVIAEAGTHDEAVAVATERQPEIAVVSLSFRDPDGIETIADILAASPGSRLLALTGSEEVRWLGAAVAAGAIGVVRLTSPANEVAQTLRAVIAGAPIRALQPGETRRQGDAAHLSRRELEILALLAQGMSNRQVAAKLFIGTETVKTHVHHILAKLEVDRRAAAVALALREGLIR